MLILHNNAGTAYATKDGVSVAKKVTSKDPYENAGIILLERHL